MRSLNYFDRLKRQYDTQRLQKFVSSTCLPPGCKATMQPGTGILEIRCESQELVDYLAAHSRILPAPADDGTNRHQNPKWQRCRACCR